MQALILNDAHLGVVRSAGTTPLTALKIQDYLRNSFEQTIFAHLDKHLIVNGDLFDQFEISMSEVLKVYRILDRWLAESSQGSTMYLLCGNHDVSARAGKVSSFEFLCHILALNHEDRFKYVLMGGLTHLYSSVWALPHVSNQDLLEVELQRALDDPEVRDGTLLLHLNYDNHFSAQADHSLNLTEEWADKLIAKGLTLVIAHEHQKRILKGGKVYITGNQWASSIADCLGNEAKYAHILEEDGSLTPTQTMDVKAEFIDVPWTELSLEIDRPFVRVSGKVKSDQASDVIQAISKFRSKSKALVVSNAVKVEGLEGLEDMEDISLEQVKAFDVLGELLELLDHKERQVVRGLLEA